MNKILLGNYDQTNIIAMGHTTNERMYSSLVVREIAGYRAVTINTSPPSRVQIQLQQWHLTLFI